MLSTYFDEDDCDDDGLFNGETWFMFKSLITIIAIYILFDTSHLFIPIFCIYVI